MNTTNINGTEIYDSNIKYYADLFIQEELDGNDSKENVKSNFEYMLFYISEHIKVNIYDLDMQRTCFNSYVYLCMKYKVLPVMRMYLCMIHMDYKVYTEWINGNVSPEYTEFAQNMHNICQTYVENALTNTDKTNINLMFISKAVYGYTETAPVQRIEKIDISTSDLLSINDRYRNIKAIESSDT